MTRGGDCRNSRFRCASGCSAANPGTETLLHTSQLWGYFGPLKATTAYCQQSRTGSQRLQVPKIKHVAQSETTKDALNVWATTLGVLARALEGY